MKWYSFLAAGAALYGQAPQNFEVAVIRPTSAATATGTSVDLFEGGRIRIVNEPVRLLIRMAFRMTNAQIVGGPAWLDSDRYDIEAKTGRPEKPGQNELGPLMQSLLADRFHLKVHREMRELPVYALVVAPGGPKLKPKAEGETSGMSTENGHGVTRAVVKATSMELLASYVGNRLGRVVVDKTALSDSYDFTLEWAMEQALDSSAPSLVTAVRELGLRLESQKSPVEVLVIDGIERPSAN